ncbi:hypothetical protein [Polaromonas sp. YR568]|uniref:hypothetical protein n=1 Tax=Polaromonas sp. YR568 TaxID=1855301 RepID=UPI0031383FD2
MRNVIFWWTRGIQILRELWRQLHLLVASKFTKKKKTEMQDIPTHFQKELDDLARKLISAFDLEFKQPSNSPVPDPVSRWLDFRLRYIEPKPRKVFKSNKFPVAIPVEIEEALKSLEVLIRDGGDINPYQSKTSVLNDTSGLKPQRRTDGLWASWGIHHLHLTNIPLAASQKFSARSDWLLFLMVEDDGIAFIDIREHSESNLWTQDDLVKTYVRSFPKHSERFRMEGVVGLAGSALTQDETGKLRNAGITTFLQVDGGVFSPPGGGVTSAVTSTKAIRAEAAIRSNLKLVAKWAADPEQPIQLAIKELKVSDAQLDLCVTQEGNLGIALLKPETVWQFHRSRSDGQSDALIAVHEGFLPQWAGKELVKHWR